MTQLTSKTCVPCQAGATPLNQQEIAEKMPQIDPSWSVADGKVLERRFTFKDFAEALAFVNKVGALAEKEGHHPDISLRWGEVIIRQMTHKINGLHENDFIMAAKIDPLWQKP